MNCQCSDQKPYNRAQGRLKGLLGRLGLVAFVFGLISAASVKQASANCFPNHLAPQAMQEVQQLAEQQSYYRNNAHWYSTSSKEQAVEVYRILAGFKHPDSVPKEIEQIHLLNITDNGFILLITDSNQTCGFDGEMVIEPVLGRRAISGANEVLEAERKQAALEKEDQYAAKSRLMDLRNILSSYDLRKQVPEHFCEELKVDPELGVVPELEEMEVNSSLRGVAVDYLHVPHGQFYQSRIEDFFKNAVGEEDSGWFNRIQHIILIPNKENTDILLGDHQHLCGFGSFASFPSELVYSWFEPYEEQHRSTKPGDPLFNMSEEERRAFQMMQGILNGKNPEQGLRELFTGKN